jgi:hypothetical protein
MEVTSICINSVLRKQWPQVCSDNQELEELQPNIIRDIIKLNNQDGFEADNADDKYVLLPHGQSLSNDELE